ncbi:MAG: hypothetical protein OXG70_03750 [Cyanobacteria bacterium MAG IRC1_bin_28]|nr:hypothetical protein [Cyanobacteria bacterium MAG IRC1_bin_28]
MLGRSVETTNHDEVIFEVSEAPEGGYDARALSHGIFTRGKD